jgi:hypothetical protein
MLPDEPETGHKKPQNDIQKKIQEQREHDRERERQRAIEEEQRHNKQKKD